MKIPIARSPQPDEAHLRSTWQAAAVPRIERSLAAALARPTGGWHVVGASGDVERPRDARTGTSIVRVVDGREVVVYRDADGGLHAGPGACPHMGARLDGCVVTPVDGVPAVLCRWHGLALHEGSRTGWATYPAHDDGVLLWVRLEGPDPTDLPVLPTRPDPTAAIAAVVVEPAVCEPADIIANRLDPWHGAWFHPYAFSHLEVDEAASDVDRLVLDVTFRLGRRLGVPVRAEFACPDARTIVMTILEGEGAGSVVETHATPLFVDAAGRMHSMMVEATIATSPRPGFAHARRVAPIVQAVMRRTAHRLWVDDRAYAERRYALRTGTVAGVSR